jgi:hypothetical protein
MRAIACAIAAAIGLAAQPGCAQADDAAAFWKTVQARCDATAAKPASTLGKRIARTAIEEFERFSGHAIDANGRLFHFGQTEAEHTQEHAGDRPTRLGDLGWWRVMAYWRSLYGEDFGDKLEVLGYENASTATDAMQATTLLRADIGDLLRAVDGVANPAQREILREAIMRTAVIDTPWSAAFVSYVMRQAGVSANAFQFANAHRVYIYDAFATSAAEQADKPDQRLYRACPLATAPRVGDLVCFEREPSLAEADDSAVRERIRAELAGPADARTVQRTHCDIVAHVDAGASKAYVVGGNIYQSVTVKKLNLRQPDLKFSAVQKGDCGGPGHWTLPRTSADAPSLTQNCSLNDKKWFVLLQVR